MIKVLVYDDSKARQEALELLINQNQEMSCVGSYENCLHVDEHIKNLLPDVVLMDIDMPVVNGIEGLRKIRLNAPNVMVIMQTVFEDEDKIFEAIRSGAHGYILKKTSPTKLIEGIHEVLEGGAPMNPSIARKMMETFQKQSPSAGQARFDLTDREQEILGYLVKGLSYKMIADTCGITYHTVNSHCKKIYEKLHVHSATEAVAKVLDNK
jgi:DNA-binding NarL/FixJ family response regulator